jgi:hypothetical protein
MGVFALGTAPGLLGVAGFTSAVRGSSSRLFFRTAGLVVILLSVFNITNGFNLIGINSFPRVLGAGSESPSDSVPDYSSAKPQNSVQIIKAVYTEADDLVPNHLTLKVNQPARLEIAVKDDGYGCMGSLAFPGLTRRIENFTRGKDLVFEFTPARTGTYRITCAMGISRGDIRVIN